MLGFKRVSDEPTQGSKLAPNAFILMIQIPYQKDVYQKDGPWFTGVDVTHNTAVYVNMSFFTVIV